MSVYYKFKSALTYDTIQFDDLHISLQDFKKAVIQQKQFGKNTNFDLQVSNAETNEVYDEQNSLIPKNSSLIVIRVPLSGTQKKWDIGDQLSSKIGVLSSDYLQENPGNIVVKSADLAALNASEDDKIQAMMFQSTVDYDPANYQRVKGGSQYGEPPPNYVCHKCHHPGHWIKDCPITVVPDIKKSSGIPQSFMTPVEDPSAPGALMTPSGKFAVPTIDMQAYKEGKKEKPFISSEEPEESLKISIPEDLTCTLCHDLMSDVVMMSCCGTSFCDECIRNHLIESDDNQCPDCKEKEVSPDTLIPNRFLRNKVNNFRNQTGYSGGGNNFSRRNDVEPPKTTDNDQDVEIIETVPTQTVVKPQPKLEENDDKEKGSAIVVLGSAARGVQPRPMPMNQRNLVGNNLKSSPDNRDGDRKKSSPGLVGVPHGSLPINKFTGPPPVINTSQLPPGFNQQTLQPIRPHFTGAGATGAGVPPVHYHPPPGVNPMNVPPHMASQNPGRMYPYGPPPGYAPHMRGGFRGHPVHPNMPHPHMADAFARNNVVEDPEAAFESYLRERERQDRMKRNRGRRSRSRSLGRWKSNSRSRSRSPSKKRSRSPLSPGMRKDSPFLRNSSRTPPGVTRRSKSKSRSRTRLRSRSPHSNSRSPLVNMKGKRSRSMTPPPLGYKKDVRSISPAAKKLRHRSRSHSETRSKGITGLHKRRRSRSRSASMSRSISRGRSYSRSPSPRRRQAYSPTYVQKRRRSRTPPRHGPPPSRNRNGNYRDQSPHHSTHYYDNNDRYKRNMRNMRYPRGSKYSNSNQSYDSNNRHERRNNNERYDDKRYHDTNRGRDYVSNEDYSKLRNKDNFYPISNNYEHQYSAYGEVAPPGTTDLPPAFEYMTDVAYSEPNHNERHVEHDMETNSFKVNIRDTATANDDHKKSKDHDRERDHERRHSKSRDHHVHYHHSDQEKNKLHDSRSRHSYSKDTKKDGSPDTEKTKKDIDEKKDESREKKDKSKRKKKKELDVEKKRKDSDADRKKKKKMKLVKKDEIKIEKKLTEKREEANDSAISDESKTQESTMPADLYEDIESAKENHELNKKEENIVLASVPELSKWEREELSSPADERTANSKSDQKEKRVVTSEILKHAENVLFQKGTKSRTPETKNESTSLKEELLVVETTREARKSGNSIQVTVPAVQNKSEDDSRPAGRISAKHRLGAKVDEKNYSSVRSLVEAKVKPRSTVKAVVEAKHISTKLEPSKHEKHEKREKHDESRKHKERKKEERSHSSEKRIKHRDSKEHKEKNRKDDVPEEIQEETKVESTDDVKTIINKKQPIIDEANFEPDYDLTESEGEIHDEAEQIPVRKIDPVEEIVRETKHLTEKTIIKADVNAEDISSSESVSDTSSDSSNDRKKRKKRSKAKKKKKVKKRRNYSSSESDSEESSDSESESDNKHKHKKKRKHKTKKSSKSAKKKKKSKHK